MSSTQSASSHAKMVPMYHYVTFGLIAVPTLYFLVTVVRDFSAAALMMAMMSVGVVFATLFARLFPLGVQDRVIRLEERLRLEKHLPEDLQGRIEEISTEHLIGLRFASDEELEGLVRRILSGDFEKRSGVKEAIQRWRPDHQRI